jgi:hypothetical protein
MGVRIGSSRLEVYRRDIDGWADAVARGDLEDYWRRAGSELMFNSIFEATEWRDIYRALGRSPDEELRARLEKFVGGPVEYGRERPETSSNSARD